ncbi:hypothetical protein HYZ76_01390 [Candidatus Falkowbacteria bacterium]|nr:hypothetical protein [Candidatus Falkowbacteria bacterium]
MIFKKKVLWFKTIRYVLEPWPDIAQIKKKFGAIYIVSYDKRNFPGFSVKVKDTPVIFLNKPLADLFSDFNSTSRNEIRKTFDNKITGLKFIIPDPDLEKNYQLSKEFEYQQGRVPERLEAYQGCKSFAAYYQGEMISSIICYDNGKVLRAKAICSKRLLTEDRDFYKIISYSTRRLVYEICGYGLENGYELFDLGSVNFTKENLAQFKMNFTKDLIKEYTYTYKSLWFRFFEKGVFLKKALKRLFKA